MPSAIEDSIPWTAYGLIGVSAMMLAYVTMMDKNDDSTDTTEDTSSAPEPEAEAETEVEPEAEPEPEPEPEPEEKKEESFFSSITGAPESKTEDNVKDGEEKPSLMDQAFATITGEQPDEKKTGGKTKKSKKHIKSKKLKGGKNKTKRLKKTHKKSKNTGKSKK